MCKKTFIDQEAKSMPGFKVFRTGYILLGRSVAGYELKPTVTWHSGNRRACTHISKSTLPVYCGSHKTSWMTQILFQDALLNLYSSKMEKYCLENTPFKIFLSVGNVILFLLVIFIPIIKTVFVPLTPPL